MPIKYIQLLGNSVYFCKSIIICIYSLNLIILYISHCLEVFHKFTCTFQKIKIFLKQNNTLYHVGYSYFLYKLNFKRLNNSNQKYKTKKKPSPSINTFMSYSSLLEYTPLIWDNISIEHCEKIKKI